VTGSKKKIKDEGEGEREKARKQAEQNQGTTTAAQNSSNKTLCGKGSAESQRDEGQRMSPQCDQRAGE
jgi:hypothetical protein